MMKTNCFAYRESLSDLHEEVITDCKVLTEPNCDKCKLFKTWQQYNHNRVEQQIKEYGRTHK